MPTPESHAPFDRAFREWAAGAPATPAAEAARRVVSRLPNRSRQPRWHLAAAATLLVALLLGVLYTGRRAAPAPPGVAVATSDLPENVVVFWLDAGNPVYFVVTPIGDPDGGAS